MIRIPALKVLDIETWWFQTRANFPVPTVGLSDVIDDEPRGAFHHVNLKLVVRARESEASADATLTLVRVEEFFKI